MISPTSTLGDNERARVLQLPRLEIGEVDLDRPGLRVDVEVEVVLARDPRARARLAAALLAGGRARDVDRRVHQRALAQLLAGQPLHRDRLAPRPRAPAAPADLPTYLRHLTGGVAVVGVTIEITVELAVELHPLVFLITVIGAHQTSPRVGGAGVRR
jgi:hypothetical protein